MTRLHRAPPAILLAVLVCLTVPACARRAPLGTVAGPGGARLVTAEQIEASGAKTAWDALRFTVPNIGFRETNRGTPARVLRRGRSSIYLDDQPRVILDGTRLTDYTVLDQISARDIFTIEVLSGIDGTTYHGTGAGNGVIIIRTKTSL